MTSAPSSAHRANKSLGLYRYGSATSNQWSGWGVDPRRIGIATVLSRFAHSSFNPVDATRKDFSGGAFIR